MALLYFPLVVNAAENEENERIIKESNELGNHKDVLIFMSYYSDITFNIIGTIVY